MSLEHERLLIVDDNEANRDMLSRRLTRKGYLTETASTGEQALEMIDEDEYPFSLVLLDIMMPGISGLDVLKQLRREYSMADLPVIMATAKGQSEDVVEALNLGANDYVSKPIDFPVLHARIESHLAIRRLSELKNEFLRIASHDLKNPLQFVLSSAMLIAEEVKPGQVMTPEIYEFVRLVENRVRQMQGIIEDFLDFQAFDEGRIQLHLDSVDLNQLTENVVRQNADYAKRKSIRLKTSLASGLPKINADPARLEQVVENLVSNAIKFSPADTEAVISTQGDGATVIFEVRDEGPGLTDEDMRRLFMKYARLSNQPTGGEMSTGLGLAICKHLVDLHGGDIGARNNSQAGATFWIRLPVKGPQLDSAETGSRRRTDTETPAGRLGAEGAGI